MDKLLIRSRDEWQMLTSLVEELIEEHGSDSQQEAWRRIRHTAEDFALRVALVEGLFK